MTSLYNQRMSLVVPESMILQANQLALIAGESALDINTFDKADYKDKDSNAYAVCSAAIKPVVLNLLSVRLAELSLPSHALSASIDMAQQALDSIVMYDETGVAASPNTIIVALNDEPLSILDALGLIRFFDDTGDSI